MVELCVRDGIHKHHIYIPTPILLHSQMRHCQVLEITVETLMGNLEVHGVTLRTKTFDGPTVTWIFAVSL